MNRAHRSQNTDSSFLNAKYCVCLFKKLAHETTCGSVNTPWSREDKNQAKCVVETVLLRGSQGTGRRMQRVLGACLHAGPLGGSRGRAQARPDRHPNPTVGTETAALG